MSRQQQEAYGSSKVDVQNSHLSSARYGYDFTVATTSGSINAALKQYLDQSDQALGRYYIGDDDNGEPTVVLNRDQVIAAGDGHTDPFDLKDHVITAQDLKKPPYAGWSDMNFDVGIEIQAGFPDGFDFEKDLQIVDLTQGTIKSVGFNMYCKRAKVVQFGIPGGHRKVGHWNVWEQGVGDEKTPWFVTAQVNLDLQDLSHELDTPYFKAHETERAALLAQLKPLDRNAFSLQQLLFFLDNAIVHSMNDVGGVTSVEANTALRNYFLKIYVKTATEQGLPIAGIVAVANKDKDKSELHLTDYNRQLTLLKDGNGRPLSQPTVAQMKSTTLDYLCQTDGHFMHGAAGFDWNWVKEGDLKQKSGVMAINRNIFAAFLKSQLSPIARKACIQINPTASVNIAGHATFGWTIKSSQDPDFNNDSDPAALSDQKVRRSRVNSGGDWDIPESGETVISFSYVDWQKAEDWYNMGLFKWYAGLDCTPRYTCDVSFSGSTVKVVQHVVVTIWAGIDATGLSCKPVDTTITDYYDLSVSQGGGLSMVKNAAKTDVQNHPNMDHRSGIVDFFTNINKLVDELSASVQSVLSTNLRPIRFNDTRSFVFPGASVFTYKNASFSGYQDLLCDITYQAATETLAAAWTQKRHARKALATAGTAASALASSTNNNNSITYSTLLMHNYIRGQLVAHEGKFEALQTSDGHSLLFAVDSQGALLMFEEQSGQTSAGWLVHDLSSVIIKQHFPGSKVATFAVGQSALDGTIGLMMAVHANDSDHLFMSMLNSPTNISWAQNPTWYLREFDAAGQVGRSIAIRGALIAEMPNKAGARVQYLVVDIDRVESGALKHVERYYIDPKGRDGFWIKHDVPVDLESTADYQCCVGRPAKDRVDGIYMKGNAAESSQLLYVPIVNFYDPEVAPQPVLFKLPNNQLPSAIATARNMGTLTAAEVTLLERKAGELKVIEALVETAQSVREKEHRVKEIEAKRNEVKEAESKSITTDLYAIAGSTLYRFDADKQKGTKSNATALLTDDFFTGTETLLAMICDNVTTLWGRNTNKEVYYVACPTDKSGLRDAWSAPVPILTGIEHISAYLNAVDGGNTIFASGGNQLQKLSQDPSSKLWQAQAIHIAPEERTLPRPAIDITSYTTTLHVTSDVTNLPAQDVPIQISANRRTPVYINSLYYVLDLTPVTVKTDSTGVVAVVEAISDINGTTLTVSVNGKTTSINPMDDGFHKLTTLAAETLKSATFYKDQDIKAGGIQGSPMQYPLVASETDVGVTATALANLNSIYSKNKQQSIRLFLANEGIVPGNLARHHNEHFAQIEGVGDDICLAAGDLFRWLKTKVRATIHLIQNSESKLWTFIAKIGDKAYHAFLDTIDAVVGAVEWIFDAIKTGIRDIINFVKFLFEWDDITRTKNLMHKVTKLYLENKVDQLTAQIQSSKGDFDKRIVDFEKKVNAWAGVDWKSLGETVQKTAGDNSSNPMQGQTAASQLLSYHFKDNAGSLTIIGASPSTEVASGLIATLLTAVSNEGKVLSEVYEELKVLAVEFSSLTIAQAITKLVGIIAGGVLSSVKIVVDALLDVLCSFLKDAVDLLDTKIHIPVISDILNAIGFSDISLLDLFTWIGAMGYTVVYKIIKRKAPFPDSNEVKALLSAETWKDLISMFHGGYSASGGELVELSADLKKDIEVAALGSSAIAKGLSGAVDPVEAEASVLGDNNPFATAKTALDLLSTGFTAAVKFIAPSNPIKDETVSIISEIIMGIDLASSVMFSSTIQKQFAASGDKFKGLAANDGRATGAIIKAILVIPKLFCSSWHLVELSALQAGYEKTADILGEVALVSGYVVEVAYAAAVNYKDPDSKQIFIIMLLAGNLLLAGVQTAQADVISKKGSAEVKSFLADDTTLDLVIGNGKAGGL